MRRIFILLKNITYQFSEQEQAALTDDDNKKTSDGWRQRDFFFMASCIDGKLQCTECKIGSLVALLLAPSLEHEEEQKTACA